MHTDIFVHEGPDPHTDSADCQCKPLRMRDNPLSGRREVWNRDKYRWELHPDEALIIDQQPVDLLQALENFGKRDGA